MSDYSYLRVLAEEASFRSLSALVHHFLHRALLVIKRALKDDAPDPSAIRSALNVMMDQVSVTFMYSIFTPACSPMS